MIISSFIIIPKNIFFVTSFGLNCRIVLIAVIICCLTEYESLNIKRNTTFFTYSKFALSRDLQKIDTPVIYEWFTMVRILWTFSKSMTFHDFLHDLLQLFMTYRKFKYFCNTTRMLNLLISWHRLISCLSNEANR